jgi:hypothetical protein
MQLVRCCLIKNDTVQHMGMLNASDLSGYTGREKYQYY